ncbi:bifunctional UDP-N-acetylmuramoyl-tripeptide:D-alanyl-D-alanine ligase/alanine racemase [Maribellus sediminis]|uniref:bifunctional UDP-N-acetylmuramoyl-tripeptide:D-alanyl-D-alanine ligase/alanine racemase n=1 Tax=Maribellus sediminis TaxID=2696285 RepID=UPI00142F8DBC|nr:bifunctional UDP-N-acetylmuramoyl-tripeptide:D-alanyl-D-alanine ligase/alanine racemase [Maribellus sediminis]
MLNIPFQDIAKALQGKIYAEKERISINISGAITDSRAYHIEENPLFFALKGPVHNGHHFIDDLISKGVRYFVISDKKFIRDDAAFILVDDTTKALQHLASYVRQQFAYPVIGITGSNGKTIVKEWLYDLLSKENRIIRSPKSYNSQVGVPLSVLLMDESYDLGIFEAGISQPGEMQHLASIIQPDIGILTNIGDAHQEFFASLEQKLDEKLLLFRDAKKLVCRIDNPLVARKAKEFCLQNKIEPVFWSTESEESTISFSVEKNAAYCQITAHYSAKYYAFQIPFTDDSAIENSCRCFAAIVALGKDPKSLLSHFANLQHVAMRLEIKQGTNQNILINDYYNSDLNSLTIALSVLKQQASESHKKVLILSDIQQTGWSLPQLYSKVNQLLQESGIDRLIGIGPDIGTNREQFLVHAEFFTDVQDFENRFDPHSIRESAILIKGARKFRFERISGMLQQKAHQTVLEINLNALVNNLNVFRGLLKAETKIMVMVKAFSYGSGDVEIARLLQFQKVDYLAVAVADEGVQLRNAGINLPIIVMNPERDSFQNMLNYRLEPNLYSIELVSEFAAGISDAGIRDFPVHLKIDTGMNRLGLKSEEEIKTCIELLQNTDKLKLQSVFSHLAGSDEEALDEFTREQFIKFEQTAQFIAKMLPYSFDRHILNSGGIERFPEKQFEMVRLGIGLYGVSQTGLQLENIGTLKSTVSQVKEISSTETVGYNRKGKVDKKSKIAIVPIGYADGIDRKLGNRNGYAFINGNTVPIIGNICMDMLMLDVSGLDVGPGDRVEFFGAHISVNDVAQKAGTIPYEILTGISQRVKRIYLQE